MVPEHKRYCKAIAGDKQFFFLILCWRVRKASGTRVQFSTKQSCKREELTRHYTPISMKLFNVKYSAQDNRTRSQGASCSSSICYSSIQYVLIRVALSRCSMTDLADEIACLVLHSVLCAINEDLYKKIHTQAKFLWSIFIQVEHSLMLIKQ